MKVFIINQSHGEYDDYSIYGIAAVTTEDAAKKIVKALETQLNPPTFDGDIYNWWYDEFDILESAEQIDEFIAKETTH